MTRLRLVQHATLLLETSLGRVLPGRRRRRFQPESADELRARGYADVTTSHPSIAMTRGLHGTEALGPVSGWVVDGVYIAGDTVWCDDVANALEEHRPRVVVVNGGGAQDADVVVVHLEAINHCIEPRSAYRAIDGVLVPDDGETL